MTQQGPPQDAVRKLPVFRTVVEAIGQVFGNLPSLTKAAALPFALSLGINFMEQGSAFSPAWSLMLIVLGLIPETYFGVAWHRFTLLGAKRAAPIMLPPLAPRHWRFLSFAVVMLMISGLPMLGARAAMEPLRGIEGQIPPELAAQVAGDLLPFMVLLIVALVLTLRFFFVFPAVAVDESYGLSDSWRHTRGQTLRLLGGLTLLIIPWLIVTNVVAAALTSGAAGQPSLAATMVVVLLFYIGMGLVFAFISIAFRDCTGWIPDTQSGPPGPVVEEEQER